MSGKILNHLVRAGLSENEAARKCELFASAESVLAGGRDTILHRWFVPGRIEVLGKHTDYAGGRSLLGTTERGICIVARARADATLHIVDAQRHQFADLELSASSAASKSGWIAYPQTVVRRIGLNFSGPLKGADIALASDLPPASGMSSSSALLTAIFTVLSAVNRLEERPEYKASVHSREDLAAYLGCMENGQTFAGLEGDKGVGTFGGSEDHTAILCCQPGTLSQYSFCPIRAEQCVPLPQTHVFVIASSGVSAPKIGSSREKYNRLSRAAQAVLKICKSKIHSGISSLGAAVQDYSPDQIREAIRVSTRRDFTPEELILRFDQFYLESEQIVPEAADALSRRDWMEFGALVDRSQRGAEEGLCNQVPETVALARIARRLGAAAASAFGAGFGGSAWALVPSAGAELFAKQWQSEYFGQFPSKVSRAEFFTTSAGPSLLNIS